MADRSRGLRQAKVWTFLGNGLASFVGNNTVSLSSVGFNNANTVLRMIGEYVILPDAATADEDVAEIGVGIGVVSSDAAALGDTAMPDPVDEPDFPWLYWKCHLMVFNQTGVDPNTLAGQGRWSFDIRSMRKVKPRESLIMVVQYVDVVGAPPLQFGAARTRVLIGSH